MKLEDILIIATKPLSPPRRVGGSGESQISDLHISSCYLEWNVENVVHASLWPTESFIHRNIYGEIVSFNHHKAKN